MGKFADALEKLADQILREDASADSPRNWTEDFGYENGRYTCQCIDCDNLFIGHKRRIQCKLCAAARRDDILDDGK